MGQKIKRSIFPGSQRTRVRFCQNLLIICAYLLPAVAAAQIKSNTIDYSNGLHGTVSVSVPEHETATLSAPAGTVFTTVTYASYGTSLGTAPSFEINPACHATTSQAVAEQYFLGKNSSSVQAENSVFGDPCVGTFKSLAIVAIYTQPICAGTSPGTISGTLPTGGSSPYTYAWEKSTTSAVTGFTAIAGAVSKDYAPGNLAQTTWFRRIVTSGTVNSTSPVLQITVSAKPVASISGNASVCKSAAAPVITFTGSGATQPYTFTYQINGGSNQVITTSSGNSVTITQPTTTIGSFVYTLVNVTSGFCTQAANGKVTVNVNELPSASATSTFTCVGGKTGTITVVPGDGQAYTYSLNTGAYSTNPVFTGLAAGTYTANVKNASGCIMAIPVTVDPYPASTDNQNATSTNTWTGHLYTGLNFDSYMGSFGEPEMFDESFGGSTTCFSVLSTGTPRSVYTENFTVKFRMQSTRKGLYLVDLGSDDGSRLTIDGELVYNNWTNQSFGIKASQLIGLKGNSALQYDFFENTGGNRVVFQNLILLLENTLSVNAVQAVCQGSDALPISGDSYGLMPAGITVSGTGYQWSFSLTPGGARTDISGATAASFTPNVATAPFNNPGTYYLYRTGTVKSTRNIGVSNYTTSLLSNAATLMVSAPPSATISYSGAPFCNSTPGTQAVTLTGNTGGSYAATPSGLSIDPETGVINPSLSTAGSYTVSYSFAAMGGCAAFVANTTVRVAHAGEWSGKIDTDWNNAGNWFCNVVPNQTMDVWIPKCVTISSPKINATANVKNLTLEDEACLKVKGLLKIAGMILNAGGHIHADSGTIEMNGSAAQSVSGSTFTSNTIQNLVVSNSGPGLSVSSALLDTLKISGNLTFGNPVSKLFTGDNITLLSDNANTANVGKLSPGNSITGKVIVERYVNTGVGAGQHNKSWQFLATPFTGETIRESWMEHGNAANGYGIVLTGPEGTAGGFDRSSPSPSIKYYNSTTDTWVAVSSANKPIYEPKGYMVFVRGDRTVDGSTVVNPTPTKLRSKGNLVTGTVPAITVAGGKFQSVGNPYASAIDFSLITKDGQIEDKFYVWDPYLYGTYGLGGYQTVSKVSNWMPVPGGTAGYPSGIANKTIQSGQAFFVHAAATPSAEPQYNLVFTENAKTTDNGKQSFARNMTDASAESQFFSASLFTGSNYNALIADGNMVAFSDLYDNAVDGNDALKLINSGENFGLKRNGKVLSIEARQSLVETDTIYYNMSNLKQQSYQLRFAPANMEAAGLEAFLVDNFLKTKTPVSLMDSSFINFTVNGTSGSSSPDRFTIVFVPARPLPVTFSMIDAFRKGDDIELTWKVETESDMAFYDIERSTDGAAFSKMASVAAKNKNGSMYHWLDKNPAAGYHYYRVKSISKDGVATYTRVVKVQMDITGAAFTVYPNPIVNNTIQLHMAGMQSGAYAARLLNAAGQAVASAVIHHVQGVQTEKIEPGQQLPKGVYHLEVTGPDGKQQTIRVVK